MMVLTVNSFVVYILTVVVYRELYHPCPYSCQVIKKYKYFFFKYVHIAHSSLIRPLNDSKNYLLFLVAIDLFLNDLLLLEESFFITSLFRCQGNFH